MGPPRHPQAGEIEAGGAGGGRRLQVEMSSQQFPRLGAPSTGLSQAPSQIANSGSAGLINPAATVNDESGRDSEVSAREHMSSSSSLQSREEKQEPVVVRPYPQVQMLSTHHAVASATPVAVTAPPAHLTPAVPLSFSEGLMKPPPKPTMPSRPIAPAPPSTLSLPPKVPGQVTVTMESSIPQASAIPVATISGQQGHPSNLHHIMTTNVQMSIIRSNAPGPPLHIGASHLPRGAAAAAVMSSSKVTTVLRPTSQLPNAATAQPAVQHIIHQPIQSRPPVTTSNAIPPAVVATVSATRAQSPVITTTAAHATDSALSRPTLSIQHPPSAAISIQRPAQSRDVTTRITLPSHPALGTPKQQLHTMAQKTIFSTGTPVAAATVAPILATNTIPSATTAGSVSHTQAPTSTIVTMTVPSHSSHATAVTTSNIPVAKVVPQQITHTSPRIQPDYPAERSSLIPISGHRASPNPVAMETRSDNRPSVPVQFQYFLPTYPPSAYPLAAHTYTPITSSVSTIRQYPVSAQAPNSAITAQTGVGVASTVHLNPMQLMTVDASHARHIQGIQPAPISTQGIQPAPIGTPGIQPAPLGTQGIHSATPINTQGLQPAPMGTQQPQPEGKTSAVVLADGATIVANPISNPFSAAPAATTVVQTHSQSASTNAPAQGSSPRPSILRKKPATDGAKPKSEIHVSMATPVTVSMETVSNQNNDQPTIAVPPTAQQPPPTIPTMIAAASPPSQPAVALSTIPGAVPITPPITTIAAAPPPSVTVGGSLSSVLGPPVPEIKVKEEVEPMDIMRPVSAVPPLATNTVSPSLALLANNLSMPTSDLPPGASPRKKPRKQQHVISTEEGDMMETNSTDDEKSTAKSLLVKAEKRKSPPKEYIDEEGVRYVPVRPRPPITLLRHYRNPWKAAYHHFQRYSDVRVKEEKKAMLQEIANQKGVSCRAQGWKVHLCAAQLLQLTNLEHDVYERLTNLQEGIIPKKKAATDDDLHRINELIQGNMQRCKLVMDQISEARDSMLKVLDHKDRVLKLLNKNGTVKKVSKLKRKEKV
ncbi:SAP130 isoform 5 [Pan troglodytes]|uniref:Histone deacetylase complex subunit SAP130 n=5 Tax=Homininae TaxID=207598 RepID=SP130_HUMAN|nr:histone deacetylase complex subunit SAP130 isoform b [Homo sapiens]XP_016805192.1 histone deacetylase complex subunit SAP130 isoform X7 [Pan troglodytes]XP_034810098.1 histone deacetylase complex subunit SAP130 isoform X7 [Pan paniscus]Q9H0E3.1 RecName: Full=Histone deacetylase complex subunit SAP130; AltName: Full=130 kDa Sin3-associated polypeptide; AltName: Full=Sin3-associated polypeptide p130 [Homo sapiens]AAI17256.1 Sin3A-associated protein, 130kDa [Homo sapiens]AAO63591.1 SIN3A-assoc|eukprot:NP_078821.2 histone deacetylase complex subunit SAP130 isoform b [Homo sapiens]